MPSSSPRISFTFVVCRVSSSHTAALLLLSPACAISALGVATDSRYCGLYPTLYVSLRGPWLTGHRACSAVRCLNRSGFQFMYTEL